MVNKSSRSDIQWRAANSPANAPMIDKGDFFNLGEMIFDAAFHLTWKVRLRPETLEHTESYYLEPFNRALHSFL